MAWTAPLVERPERPRLPDERTGLDAALEYERQTLLLKCSDLDAERLKRRAVPPSSLSLLGLVRHLAEVERWWFRRNFAGEQAGDMYVSESNPDGEFDDIDTADAAADFAVYAAEVELARQATERHHLDETFMSARHVLVPREPIELNLRSVYLRVIEEYARHIGHADLLRQRIDGRTGD